MAISDETKNKENEKKNEQNKSSFIFADLTLKGRKIIERRKDKWRKLFQNLTVQGMEVKVSYWSILVWLVSTQNYGKQWPIASHESNPWRLEQNQTAYDSIKMTETSWWMGRDGRIEVITGEIMRW